MRTETLTRCVVMIMMLTLAACRSVCQAAVVPQFESEIAPLLNKYCAGCHNPEESNAELDLTTMAALRQGGESGLVLTPGSAASSRMIGVLTGKLEPAMPPEDQPHPTVEEVELLARWIDAGAPAADGESSELALRVPYLQRSQLPTPITSLDYSPDGRQLAVGRYQQIELLDGHAKELWATLGEHPGKVNDLRFSSDGDYLIAATGVTGLRGEAWLWNVKSHALVRRFGGHRDVLYTAALSDDGKLVATAGYDRVVLIHDRATGEVVHRLQEHNGAVYDLCFSPDSQLLVTASADSTVKVWSMRTGARWDTRGEPLKEQSTAAIHPSGRWFVGAGGDNRIRMWQLVSRDGPRINPVVYSRFAHEGAVERVRYSRDGRFLASVARDRSLKVWDAERLEEIALLPAQVALVQALAIAPDGSRLCVGRMDGTLQTYEIHPQRLRTGNAEALAATESAQASQPMEMAPATEMEPNSRPQYAQVVSLPAAIQGALDMENEAPDASDLFAMDCQSGQRWILEVRAARDKSPLDSYLEVLDANGNAVPQLKLQAVRDAYFTFRGKDSNTTGDFRLHNWEEMRMNQLLYCNGEVVRLYHYPRGPDSGFSVFPNFGSRQTMFDTTAITHPLGETCYIVEPYPMGATLVANGLPVFTLYVANDDDAERKLGSDSRIVFDVPRDGRYLVRLRDARGFHGTDFKYQLEIRPPDPRFTVREVIGKNPQLPRGNGTKFGVQIDRIDGFDAAVRIDVTDVPPGFHVTTPLIVEPGQFQAFGLIWSDDDAQAPEQSVPPIRLTATTDGPPQRFTLDSVELGRPQLSDPAKITVHVEPTRPPATATEDPWPVLEIHAGSTQTVRLSIERREFTDRVGFGNHESAINAPFGVYVDNIGLNGVLIPENETERTVFITADRVTAPGDRLIFFTTGDGGSATSNPLLLRVLGDIGSLD